MQEHFWGQRSSKPAKGVIILMRRRFQLTILVVLLLSGSVFAARDYIDVWPAGWSEVTQLFNTGIFTDRFLVTDMGPLGTIFLTEDGLYFKELDLVLRVAKDGEVLRRINLAARRELISHRLGTDGEGNIYAVWIEKSAEGYSLNYTNFDPAKGDPELTVLLVTDHTIRDLDAFQEDDITHVVWSEWEEHLQIKYGKIESGQLVTLAAVTDNTNVSVRPSVTVDHGGRPAVAWVESDAHQAVRIYFSKETEAGWTPPLVIGSGSMSDIEQGGSIALLPDADRVVVAWAALPHNSDRLFVHMSEVSSDLRSEAPVVLALGSRPRLLKNNAGMQLVWQGQGQFGSCIRHAYLRGGKLENITNLTVGRKAGFRPEVISREGYIHVYWLQADPERGFNVHTINNRYPKEISWWQKAGIDEKAPAYHLLYLFVSNFMLSFVYLFGHGGVLLVGGLISGLLQKIPAYGKQNLFYKITVTALILLVVRNLPIPMTNLAFFGLIHYGISVVLSILGTYFILRGVQPEGIFSTMAIVLLWTFLFLFFSLIPQTILG